MIKDKSIFIKNIYYMLAYAFEILNQGGYERYRKAAETRALSGIY